MSSRKAQEISLNVIILAAIALLALVIISIILITKMSDTNRRIDACDNNGGTCMAYTGSPTPCQDQLGPYARPNDYKCYDPITKQPSTTQVCCTKV